MKKVFAKGDQIRWNWMGRAVKGVVKQIYFKPVVKTFRGTVFKRNGTKEKPAYLVQSEAGSKVLKSHSELSTTRRSTQNKFSTSYLKI